MLSREDNMLMCDVSPGTPMNAMMKRYWLPALPSAALGGPDSDPVRVTLLGEDYVVFRDSHGKIGMLDERCCHRGASLCLGRVEEGGIRCIYHGWKFDTTGAVMDMPNATDDKHRTRYRQPAYPVREAANVVWVYLGPAEHEPPFPNYPIFDLPPENIVVQEVYIDANYAQVMEGLVDSSHVGVLHQDAIRSRVAATIQEGRDDIINKQMADELAPQLELEDTDFGYHVAALRSVQYKGNTFEIARTTAFALPFINFPGSNTTMIAGVPEHNGLTRMIEWNWDWNRPIEAGRRESVLYSHGITDTILDARGMTRATYGKVERPSAANNYLQDRAAMRNGSFTGLPLFHPEDAAVSVSQGAICDRSTQNLLPADIAVVRMRRVLLDSVRRVMRGEAPLGVQAQQVPRALQGIVQSGAPWQVVFEREVNWTRSINEISKHLFDEV
ncbi:Rieske 2Fe-2S domain-containing protein [Paraburkholderia sp. J67]|uniref:Rieske 2Fe-2S domain-containing protein n=1 Tax=Paraburkholderia sp. J67 TaxID=2805435 RepID=UPI002ABE420F|nr:Rieske 2Fe-2S domain-containing protein [Paraburkholderia sp. J67]